MVPRVHVLLFVMFAAAIAAAEREFCAEGEVVKLACPDGYLVTGLQSPNTILNESVTPVCSEIADKINPEFRSLKRDNVYYNNPPLEAECDSDNPILLSFDMCFYEGRFARTNTECGRFLESVTVKDTVDIEDRADSKILECPEGSFFNGLWMERDEESDILSVGGTCYVIEE